MARSINLSDRIPIWKIEQGIVISKQQTLSLVFELTMPEAYSLSETGLEEIYDLFTRIVKAMPSGYVLHKQDYYTYKQYERGESGTTFLGAAYERVFQGRPFLDHKSYIIITKKSNDRHITNNLMTGLLTGRFIKKDIQEGVPEFINVVKKIQYLLTSAAIPARQLNGKEVIALLNTYYNLGEQRILKDISFDKDSIRIGAEELVIYNTISPDVEMPVEIDSENNIDAFFDRSYSYSIGIGFSYPHIVNTVFVKHDTARMIKELGSRREKLKSMTFKSRENEKAVDEFDEFLSVQIRDGLDPIYVTQNVMLWGKGETFEQTENELSNALAKMDSFAQRNFNCASVFWGCTPGNAADIPLSEYQIQFASVAALFMPIETNPKNAGIDGIKLSERDYGIPITIDNWVLPMKKGLITNRNMFVLGPSGSGKSFFVNNIVRQLIEQGYHITIIDVGGSYRRLCTYMGGTYFEYTAESKMAFNPFYIAPEEEKNLEEQESLKTLIFTIWKRENQEIGKEEYTVLSKCIVAYYEYVDKQSVKASFNTFYRFVLDEFQQQVSNSERGFFDFNSFEVALQAYYTGGEYDYLLNSEAEFSIADLKFCVFELDEIKDHPIIFPVVALVIMDAFVSKMRKHKAERKIIFIEEAWSAISSKGMANFLKYLYKTVRKFNGAVGIVTQELEDIVGNEFVKNTILNNADIQILLDQTKYQTRFEELARLLGLPNSEIKKVMSINKISRPGDRSKDVYLRFGSVGKVYSTIVSPEEAAMFTTEAADGVIIDGIAKQTGDMEYAIREYLDRED